LVAWIDSQLRQADQLSDPQRLQRMVQNLVEPMRHIYGVSDKVLMMTLTSLLLGGGKPLWAETGANMIAIDTLVHNFLHRTGILHRLNAWRYCAQSQFNVCNGIDDRQRCNGHCQLYSICDRKALIMR
jgi:hypothetical protein